VIAPVHSTKKLLSKAERPRFHWFRTITFLFSSFLEHSLGIATFHTTKGHGTYPLIMVLLQTQDDSFRVQRKSVLQLAIQASCS